MKYSEIKHPYKLLIPFIICIAVFGYVGLVSAALVPCGNDLNSMCTTCDFFKLADNVKNFLMFKVVPPVGVLFVIIAGFFMLIGGAKPSNYEKGKKILTDVVWGLLIIFGAWMLTNTALKLLASKSDASGSWYKIECTATGITPGVSPGPGITPRPSPTRTALPPPGPVNCSDPKSVAAKYSEPYPRQNAPELTAMINCIRSRLPGQNLGSTYTYDNSHPICNYTRGSRVCGACSHAVNSCHYGGRTGTQGALAVDFGNEAIGNQIVQAALACGAKSAICENANGKTVSCVGGGANHIHANAGSCDNN